MDRPDSGPYPSMTGNTLGHDQEYTPQLIHEPLPPEWQAQAHGFGHVRNGWPPQMAFNAYGAVNMEGSSLHQGNNYFFGTPNQEHFNIQRLLDSLYYPEMHLRSYQTSLADSETFEWIYDESYADRYRYGHGTESDSFVDWLSGQGKLFWIAGKPGSGKSTLMKFLASHKQTAGLLKPQVESQEVVILRHSFWLHGTENQRNLKGFLATLIHQCLEGCGVLCQSLLEYNAAVCTKRMISDWSTLELKSTLLWLLEYQTGRTCVFIDALDEFDKSSVFSELWNIIKDLTSIQNIKICVSSRQENFLENKLAVLPKIRLQDLTYEDIGTMAETKLNLELQDVLGISRLDTSIVQGLAWSVVSRAEGVFLWAVLAIKSLTLGIHNLDDMPLLEGRLAALPQEMKHLFEQMWGRLQSENELYGESTSLYFAMSQALPCSLLTFTIAVDEDLYRRSLQSEGEVDDLLMATLVFSCKV
ncbi:hypothetical protein OHC33_001667 [Knufia fluminis]|uniref:Nephrocystin 3-like N-terminal domain-containing protein n=1 Tax=Knufia fluminis TaxID=191047 RepID=A0AAN8EN10_9EURO|nr:hypothetical protein OHC33_001667 [Knufia fluminis]